MCQNPDWVNRTSFTIGKIHGHLTDYSFYLFSSSIKTNASCILNKSVIFAPYYRNLFFETIWNNFQLYFTCSQRCGVTILSYTKSTKSIWKVRLIISIPIFLFLFSIPAKWVLCPVLPAATLRCLQSCLLPHPCGHYGPSYNPSPVDNYGPRNTPSPTLQLTDWWGAPHTGITVYTTTLRRLYT